MALRQALVSSFVSSLRNQQVRRYVTEIPTSTTTLDPVEPKPKPKKSVHWGDFSAIVEDTFHQFETHDEIAKLGTLDYKMMETFGTSHAVTQSISPYLKMLEQSGKQAPFTLSDETERDLLNGLEKVKPKETYSGYKDLMEDFLDRVIGIERGAGWEFEDAATKRNEILDMAETLVLAKGAGAVKELMKEGDMDAKLRRSLQEVAGLNDDHVFHSSLYRAPTKLFLRPTLKAQHRFMNRIYRACLEYGDDRETARNKAIASNYVNMGSDWVRRTVEIDWDRKSVTMQLNIFNEDHKIIKDIDLTADRRLHVGPLGCLSPSDRAIGNRICNTIAHDPDSISYLKFKHQNAVLPIFARQCILKHTFEYPMRGEWWNLFRNTEWPTSFIHKIAGKIEDKVPISETLEY